MTERYAHLGPENTRAALSILDKSRNSHVNGCERPSKAGYVLLFPKLRLGNPAQEALLPDRLCTFAPELQKQTGSWSFRLENSQAELGNQRSRLVPALPA
jgi:hypothetical protein